MFMLFFDDVSILPNLPLRPAGAIQMTLIF